MIAIISLEQSSRYPSRHSSGLKSLQVADIVPDNKVPPGDGLCQVGDNVSGVFSSIAGMALLKTICVEVQKAALSRGIIPQVFFSQNVDGFANDHVYSHFEGRLKCI